MQGKAGNSNSIVESLAQRRSSCLCFHGFRRLGFLHQGGVAGAGTAPAANTGRQTIGVTGAGAAAAAKTGRTTIGVAAAGAAAAAAPVSVIAFMADFKNFMASFVAFMAFFMAFMAFTRLANFMADMKR